jgi:hypothetical protein
MALATAHILGLSLAAGLVAGTGAVANHLISSTPAAPAAVAATIERSCATQTWPYINQNCLNAAPEGRRKIRLVAAPSGIEPVSYAAAAAAAAAPAPAEPELVTSDTVLRQPQRIATTGADAAEKAIAPKPKAKRATQKDRRYVAQSYQVPMETRGATGPVIVVRPISVEYIKPCDDRRC